MKYKRKVDAEVIARACRRMDKAYKILSDSSEFANMVVLSEKEREYVDDLIRELTDRIEGFHERLERLMS